MSGSLVVVGLRKPRNTLYDALIARKAEWADAGLRTVDRIGDALAPGALVHAIHSGHLYARTLDGPAEGELPYRLDNGAAASASAPTTARPAPSRGSRTARSTGRWSLPAAACGCLSPRAAAPPPPSS